GGIETAEDVLEYLTVGASAVQVGTAHFVDPRASWQLVEQLRSLCKQHKMFTMNEISGTYVAEIG
ncbi:MAG: dihydroorotate dehydrogenase, partial [Bryobacteraceae bacterium]